MRPEIIGLLAGGAFGLLNFGVLRAIVPGTCGWELRPFSKKPFGVCGRSFI